MHHDVKLDNVVIDTLVPKWEVRVRQFEDRVDVVKELADGNRGEGYNGLKAYVIDCGHATLRGDSPNYSVKTHRDTP